MTRHARARVLDVGKSAFSHPRVVEQTVGEGLPPAAVRTAARRWAKRDGEFRHGPRDRLRNQAQRTRPVRSCPRAPSPLPSNGKATSLARCAPGPRHRPPGGTIDGATRVYEAVALFLETADSRAITPRLVVRTRFVPMVETMRSRPRGDAARRCPYSGGRGLERRVRGPGSRRTCSPSGCSSPPTGPIGLQPDSTPRIEAHPRRPSRRATPSIIRMAR